MIETQYTIQYSPLFYKDLLEKASYIANDLNNSDAANRLVDAVERAILERSWCAESFEPYPSKKKRENPYYAIYVDNFVIYYVVLNHTVMEVRRFLYKRQNRWKLLERSDR